ncbi:MAG: hypothetical protein D6762_00115, partial [Candidatus Neomarinimicrobiota bacterium]
MIKRYATITLLCILSGGFLFGRTATAILDFDAINLPAGDAQALTERFRTEMQRLDTSRIFLDRARIKDVLAEQGLQEAFCTEEECAVEIGTLLGVQEIIVGSVAKVGATYT